MCWIGKRLGGELRIKVAGWGERWRRLRFTRHEIFLLCAAVFGANLELPQAADTFK